MKAQILLFADNNLENIKYNLNNLKEFAEKAVFVENSAANDTLLRGLKDSGMEFKTYDKNKIMPAINDFIKNKDIDAIVKFNSDEKVFLDNGGLIRQGVDKLEKNNLDFVCLDYGRYFTNWSPSFQRPVEFFKKDIMDNLNKLSGKSNYRDILRYKFKVLETSYVPDNVFTFYKNVTDNMQDVIPFPGSLCVEITNHCNLNCTVCYCRDMARPKVHMDVNLIKRIIDMAAQYPQTRVIPNLSGESLTHPNFFEIVKYAKDKGFKMVAIDSNGLLLGGNNLEKVFSSGLDDIGISVNAVRPETYEKVVNTDINKLFKVVDDILERRKMSPDLKPSLLVQMVEDEVNKDEIEEYIDFWTNKLTPGHDAVCIKRQMDPKGRFIDRSLAENIRIPCYKMWYQLVILSSGKAVMCGFDYDSRFIIGDANKETLYDIWHGEKMMEFRRKHIENRLNEIDICAPCEINQEFIPGRQVKQTTKDGLVITESQMFKIYQKQAQAKKISFFEKILSRAR